MPFNLDKVGSLLRAAREEKGLSLVEVSRVLFIRKSMLNALESADWKALPDLVYVKGYIAQYAALLGISVQDAVEIEHEENGGCGPAEIRETKSSYKINAGRFHFTKKAAAVLGLSFIVVGFLIFQNMRSPVYVAPSSVISHQSHVGTYQAGPGNYQTLKSAYDVHGESPLSQAKKLVITCQERTWLRVMIDDSEKKELMLNPEEVVMFNAKEKFDLIIGNAGGVKLLLNGQDTGFSGEQGEVKHVVLP